MKISIQIFLFFCLFQNSAFAQMPTFDSTGLQIILVKHADSAVGYNAENNNYQRLLGSVVIEHNGITLTCDSAHLFQSNEYVEAFSNVHITKVNGENATSDYIKYTGNNNTAFMKGAVQIIDGANTLNTEELTYNIKTKIGKYYKGGTLQNEETTVSSETGTYNGFTQLTHFKTNVEVTNPKYNIVSKELTYNMKSKVVRFLAESIINTDNSTITTSSGSFDSKNSNAVFNTRTTIENEDQIIIGNKITYNDQSGNAFASGDVIVVDVKNNSKLYSDKAEYNKQSGAGKATGNVFIEQEGGSKTLSSNQVDFNKKNGYYKATGKVVFIDTAQHSKLLSGVVEYNDNSKFMIATINPKLITVNDGDSLFMRADTMMTLRQKDKNELKKIITSNKKTGNITYAYNLLFADSTYKSLDDSPEPKLIIANKNVKLFSDSMQCVSDSLSYSEADSMFRLYKNPVMWSKQQQANADTIYLKTIDNKLSEVNLLVNSLLISSSKFGNVYDQVAGNYVNAYFVNNEIDHVFVNQNAESLYYAKDDKEEYIGVNKAESSSMDVYFKDKELDHIVMHENPKGDFLPIDKLTQTDKFLGSFKLLTERKPKSKEEILID